MNKGFIRVPRTFFETEMWTKERKFSQTEAFVYLAEHASYRAEAATRRVGNHYIVYERDELVASVSFLAQAWNWTIKAVRYYLNCLEREGLITIRHTARGYCNVIRVNFEGEEAADADDLILPEDFRGKEQGNATGQSEGTAEDNQKDKPEHLNISRLRKMESDKGQTRGQSRSQTRPIPQGKGQSYNTNRRIKEEEENNSLRESLRVRARALSPVKGKYLNERDSYFYQGHPQDMRELFNQPATVQQQNPATGTHTTPPASQHRQPNSQTATADMGNASSPTIPTAAEVRHFFISNSLHLLEADWFYHYCTQQKWQVGQNQGMDWKRLALYLEETLQNEDCPF